MIPLGVLASARIAAASGWTPADLASLDFWYSADSLTGLADTDALTAWPDLSAAGNNGISVETPIYRTAQINGLPAIYLAGSYVRNTASASAPEQTVAAVVRTDATNANRTIYGPSVEGGLQLRHKNTGAPELLKSGVHSLGTASTALTAGAWAIVVGTYSDTANTWALRVNRAAAGSGATAQTLTTGAESHVGSHYTSTQRWDGMIAEILHCPSVLDAGDIASVESYLAAKYGL